jgi:hypothetical protein
VIKRNRTGVLVKRAADPSDEYDLWARHGEDSAAPVVVDFEEPVDAVDDEVDEADAVRAPQRRTWTKVQFALAALSATPVLFIGGVHAWPWSDTPAAANNTTAAPTVAAGHEHDPVSISLGRLGINTSLDALTTDAITGVPQVPGLGRAGWISTGVAPGDLGRAVILGRRSQSGQDVFAKLVNARAGDKILVTTAEGKTLTFVVRSVEQYTAGHLPESRIDGGGKKQAQLRLITSAGTYDQSKGGFPRNLVVFADLVK